MKSHNGYPDELVLRIVRAGIYAFAAYVLLRNQSLYSGSYIFGALVVFLLAMTRRSLVLVQTMLGILFILALLSDQLIKVVDGIG